MSEDEKLKVLDALQRHITQYDLEIEGIERDIEIRKGQLQNERDYRAILGKVDPHTPTLANYLSGFDAGIEHLEKLINVELPLRRSELAKKKEEAIQLMQELRAKED